jgi:integrase
METVTDKRGRTYERRRRPLSNTSINAMITLLGQILQQALDYELIDRNPVRVGGRSARFLKRVRPNRTFLEVDEFHALLDAAGELEAEARRDFKGLGRRAMVATLGLAGLRISEMMDLRVAQVDLVRSRFKLADAKTEAGVREVEITLYLRDELLAHVMDRQARGLPLAPSDHFFGTRPAGGVTRTDFGIGSSPARRSGRRPTARRRDCRRCRRSRRTRCGAPGRRSRR